MLERLCETRPPPGPDTTQTHDLQTLSKRTHPVHIVPPRPRPPQVQVEGAGHAQGDEGEEAPDADPDG